MRLRDWLRVNSVKGHPGRWERIARLLTLALVLGLPAGLLGVRLSNLGPSPRVIELVARQPGAGGWSQDRIVVHRGERVRLRIRSEDVVHGFAIGQLGVDAGTIEPGKPVEVEFVAREAGEFTFYCTTWCDPNHPRMRGILEVRGQAVTETAWPNSASDILLQHLDDPRDARVALPGLPSAARGLALYAERCASCHGEGGEGTARAPAIGRRELLADRSPVQVFRMLVGVKTQEEYANAGAHGQGAAMASKAVSSHAGYARPWSDQDRWDAVSYLWSLGTTPDSLANGQRLYLRNCAACHGESGRGDGPGGRVQPKRPANFTDARRMLAGTGSLYTAKIRRGGMGTGMPYWGSIFTEEELAALVDYLWSFSLGTQD